MQYEATTFFALATLGAASVMASFVGLVASAAGGGTYALIRMTGQTRRIAAAPDGRRRLRGQPVPGYSHVNLNGEHYYRPAPAGYAGGTDQASAGEQAHQAGSGPQLRSRREGAPRADGS